MERFFKFALVALILFSITGTATAEDPIDFNRQIRPILNKHCMACHGPDEGDRQAGLRLDTFDDATDSAIMPGDAESSDFIDRIITDDEDLRMPPAEHADALNADEVELLSKWIDQGAQYKVHWAFAPIAAPPMPAIELQQGERLHNSIDNFILQRVREAGLEQNSQSDPSSLIRRASLDLTGLPPSSHSKATQKSFNAYIAQPSQEAFGTVVDQLLESQGYAEHWASVWMDIARYADTCGYAGDENREIWPWRDWLIRSLQDNKSYQDLSTEMLAGDLLPNATKQQQLATAFHRNTLSNNEGGTNDEEFRTIAVKDRLSTTLNAWMGLTVRCAECHSHKYDPISHVEYYQLLDFFNHTEDADKRDDRPKLEVPVLDPATIASINKEIDELKKSQGESPPVWNDLRPIEMKSRAGTKFKLLDDNSILASGPLPGVEEYAFTFEVPAETTIRAIRLEALPRIEHNGNVGRAPEGSFILSQIRLAKIDPTAATEEIPDEKPESNSKAEPDSTKEKDEASKNKTKNEVVLPFALAANDFNQPNRHAKNAILEKVEPGGDQGWAVKDPIDGYRLRHEAIFELKEPLVAKETTKFKVYLLFDPPWKRLNMGCVRISTCDTEDAVAKYEKKELDPFNRQIANLIAKRDKPVRVPVIQERKEQRETHVMLRGNFQSKGEKVSAAFPESLTIAGEDFELNRLGLTNWMFNQQNPLTARVAVNRYWGRVMGIGLVETEEDFGTQGSTPSHPELLDHLATEFRDGGWDVRMLLKKIVMSSTYQQSQNVTEEMLDVDPRNILFARGPRVRLSAEVVRDQALAVSGLLSDKMFGKPVYPPSPVKRIVNAFTGGMTWQASQGEDRYRRALYTFLKRSSPHPLFETFDMSSRDVCSMRRIRTNTPLQSFMTLNDITFIEAARSLGEKMLKSTAAKQFKTENDRLMAELRYGIQLAIYKPADEKQIQVLTKVYRNSTKRFESDLKSAAELYGQDTEGFDGQKLTDTEKAELVKHAAMTVVSNVILNLDSFLNN